MTERREASLTQIVLIAILPTMVFAIGEGAIIPIIPTVARSLGVGLDMAGFIAGSLMIGTMLGDLPSGPIVARVGERRAMLGALGLSMVGVLACALAPSPWVLLAGVLLIGVAAATFGLARHAFLTVYAPVAYRARVLSTLGGASRAGLFIGPFLTAAVISATGQARHAYFIYLAAALVALGILLFTPDVERHLDAPASPGSDVAAAVPASVWATVAAHRRVLVRLGLAAGLVALLRAARNVVLPLWALSIGMDDATAALVIGVSGGVDFGLFFVSGWIMDRFGRVWSAMPSLFGMGVAFGLLALTAGRPSAATWFLVLAVVLGVANGIGSGILMTLGADLAPRHNPASFLGAWRLMTDTASAAVPFVVAGVTAAASLSATAGVLGGLGLLGAVLMRRWIPRYVPHG